MVKLRCGLQAGGAIGDCETVREEPPGQGFAAAAQSLVGHFRIERIPAFLWIGKAIQLDLTVRFTDPHGAKFQERGIGQPRWLEMPDPDRAAALFPVQAAAKGFKTGRGVASCRVGAGGHLAGCVPGAADPEGLGFSEAAVIAAAAMRMNPWTRDGGPVNGTLVSIPIRFNLTANAKPESHPAP